VVLKGPARKKGELWSSGTSEPNPTSRTAGRYHVAVNEQFHIYCAWIILGFRSRDQTSELHGENSSQQWIS
jgi:hypothetical protein